MSLPETLSTRLDDEEAVATVPLGGDDILVVTPSRTLVYRAEGLLSDESVEEYPHGAERVTVSQGRRKAKLTVDYGLDGERTVSLPAKRLDDALHPVLAGTLSAAGITDPGESALRTFRFSELTLVITSARVVKHVGTAVWDSDYEEFHYEDVTDLGFEEGSVATSVVLTVDGRQERFKAPNEEARAVQEALVDALCDYYDVASLEEFRLAVEPDEEEPQESRDPTDFGEGPDPLSAEPAEAEQVAEDSARAPEGGQSDRPLAGGGTGSDTVAADTATGGASDATDPGGDSIDDVLSEGSAGDAVEESADNSADPLETGRTTSEHASETGVPPNESGAAAGFEGTFEPATAEGDDLAELHEEIESLRRTVERQGERIERQSTLIEQLIEELRRGR